MVPIGTGWSRRCLIFLVSTTRNNLQRVIRQWPLVSGFGSGAYSAKLLNGTRQRFSGFSQPRQCGDVVLRMLVTGGPAILGGGDMPHRIIASSVPVSVLRIT